MLNFVIIGQSSAAFAAVSGLRKEGAQYKITLISTDTHLPYRRDVLPRLAFHRVSDKDIFWAPESYYRDNNIDLVLDKEISRINVERRKIFLSQRTQIDFDALLITDAPTVCLPNVKGVRRKGVFDLARLDSVRRAASFCPLAETVFIVPSSVKALEYAVGLKQLGNKEVVLLSGEELVFAALFGKDHALTLQDLLVKSGIRVLANSRIETILGDTEVKALRMESGKVFACDMVVFESPAPDITFLEGADLIVKERVCVHTNMRSSVPHVYAADAMMEWMSPPHVGAYAFTDAVAALQAQCALDTMLGRDALFQFPDLDPVAHMERLFSSDIRVSL